MGTEGKDPIITRLGKTDWVNLKKRIKKKITIIAKELIKLYAQSELAKGFSHKKHEWEDELASTFEFEETEDQKKAINEILADMEEKKVMNRLLVGDVGFGKTEVAIRAAFRSFVNNKQTIILCPTTILVSQHFSVFKHRLKNFPITIETLSRFNTPGKNSEVVKKLNNNKIDIIIGTHRLLSNDVKIPNLGLLIIDEEQRFGVLQKEKLRKLAYGVDVLSLSATPIPRTLSMALSNLREISLISTPPSGRRPVKVFLDKFDWNKIVSSIQNETKRGGQIYLIHNNIKTIETLSCKLQKLIPNVNFQSAHGRMHPKILEKIMQNFYDKKIDCLVTTTIIENGIDIKNVNTIIINFAENFGLSDLYQLKGRVGRAKKQAYCHLFYHNKSIFEDKYKLLKKGRKLIIEKARQRLETLLSQQELGSCFNIASKDLEIRGAGNLLGKEQHGNIIAVGLGLYTQILGEEIEKLKNQIDKIKF